MDTVLSGEEVGPFYIERLREYKGTYNIYQYRSLYTTPTKHFLSLFSPAIALEWDGPLLLLWPARSWR
jgi:hypothetical protein